MISPRHTALYIAIGAMAFAAGEAVAGCKYIPYPTGSYVCASYIKGSTECKMESFGDPGYGQLTNPECYITGVNQYFEAYSYLPPESEGYVTLDAFCSTGSPPDKVCIADPIPTIAISSVANASLGADAAKKKPKKPKDCKPKKKGKPGGKGDGDDDNDCSQRSGAEFLRADLPAPTCTGTAADGFDCVTQGKVDLGTCTAEGGVPGTYVATEFLGIAFACITDPEGVKSCNYADPLYQHCTLDAGYPDGYNCKEIYTGDVGPFDPPPQVPPPEPPAECNSYWSNVVG